VLDQTQLARWLLVFDNVESATLLKDYTPLAGPGSVLFTSRDPFAKYYLSLQSGMDLLAPVAEDAVALLQRLTYSVSSPQELDVATRLVKRLDCLPIAILHVAGIIASQDLTRPCLYTRGFRERFDPGNLCTDITNGLGIGRSTAVGTHVTAGPIPSQPRSDPGKPA